MAPRMSRREFVGRVARTVGAWGLGSWYGLRSTTPAASAPVKGYLSPHRARFFRALPGRRVKCLLCPRQCEVGDRERGYCGVRENRGGTYYSLVYGNPCVIHNDPIEKKPILHALPGSKTLTLATAGCNLNCKYCQNWEFSQSRPEDTVNHALTPEQAVAAAKNGGLTFIAFDYTEPVVFYEYVYDTARLAREKGLRTVMASACYIRPIPLKMLCPYLDVLKVDLKGFTETFYWEICRGQLAPVLEAAQLAQEEGVWVELVHLIVPTLNDDLNRIWQMCRWIVSHLGPDVPLTFSRFYPMYQLRNLPPTPLSTLERAKQVAEEVGLRFVYLGNVPAASTGRNTYCPRCGKLLIQRIVYEVKQNRLRNGRCPACKTPIPGVWE